MVYKTLYGNPLDFSKIYDKIMNDEIRLTYLLFSMYLSVLCSLRPFGAILSDLSSPNGPKLHRTDKYKLNKRLRSTLFHHS